MNTRPQTPLFFPRLLLDLCTITIEETTHSTFGEIKDYAVPLWYEVSFYVSLLTWIIFQATSGLILQEGTGDETQRFFHLAS